MNTGSKLYRSYPFQSGEQVGVPVKAVNRATNTVVWTNVESHDRYGRPYVFYVREMDRYGNDITPRGFEKTEAGLVVVNVAVDMKSPQTGDRTNIWLYALLALISDAAAALLPRKKRR